MLFNNCGGILLVVKIHEAKEPLGDRLCDVECVNCNNVLHYQPYDSGLGLNLVPKKE